MTGGAKSLKPDDYKLIRRERDETSNGGPSSYRPIRILGQGVLTNGEVKRLKREAVGKPTNPQPAMVRDEVCSPIVISGKPEARRSMPGQAEALGNRGGGPKRY